MLYASRSVIAPCALNLFHSHGHIVAHPFYSLLYIHVCLSIHRHGEMVWCVYRAKDTAFPLLGFFLFLPTRSLFFFCHLPPPSLFGQSLFFSFRIFFSFLPRQTAELLKLQSFPPFQLQQPLSPIQAVSSLSSPSPQKTTPLTLYPSVRVLVIPLSR